MTQLHQQLQEAIREAERIRKIKEHTSELTIRLESEEKALLSMEETLTKEQRDVETLEREGLTTMLRKFIGDREEKLDKEREEYLRASLRYNEIYKSVELIRFELNLLTKKEQNLEVVERKVATLINQREQELMHLNPEVALHLKGIHEQTDKLHKYSIEVEEAFKAGQEALTFVRGAEQHLLDAQLMGQRDMWGSKSRYGLNSGRFKHESIDKARDMAYQSHYALIRFGNELKDVFKNLQLEVNMQIEDFGRFADIFFDNIISDYLVQQKITKSLVNVTGTRQKLDHIMQSLDNERNVIREKLEALETERKQVIESSER